MFSSIKNFFIQAQTEKNENESNSKDNKKISKNLDNYFEKEKENLKIKLSMEIFKLQNEISFNYDINSYNSDKMFEVFFGENLRNWR